MDRDIDADMVAEIFGREGVSEAAASLIIEKAKEGKPVPMFFYGTLRKGGGNDARFSSGVTKVKKNAQAPGVLYFPGFVGYPGARFDEEGTMIGDLFWYEPDSRDLLGIFRMEIGAGYTAEVIKVTYERKTERPRRKTIEAISFQYERFGFVTGRDRWTPVPGNDWFCSAAVRVRGQGY